MTKMAKSIGAIKNRESVIKAMAECDMMGRDCFLKKHRFQRAKSYFVKHKDRLYDSKAIVGVAFGFEHPKKGALKPSDFSGGESTVARKLIDLGFEVKVLGKAERDLKNSILSDLQGMNEEEKFWEGKESERYVNHYERNSKLRAAAVAHHGKTCAVCNFNFGDAYGDRGSGYIEVHHLKPVSTLRGERRVDPKADMVVLCSNCHRMIHRRKQNVLTVDELKRMVRK